jgi:hypothetical protein
MLRAHLFQAAACAGSDGGVHRAALHARLAEVLRGSGDAFCAQLGDAAARRLDDLAGAAAGDRKPAGAYAGRGAETF